MLSNLVKNIIVGFDVSGKRPWRILCVAATFEPIDCLAGGSHGHSSHCG
jgi:hypothetical protein